jgi:acetyl esterase/lipase
MKFLLAFLMFTAAVKAQELVSDIPYGSADKLQVLDVYSPADAEDCPVIFWIHGGGWETGDKSEVHIKPRVFTERGYVFVSTNYRLWPRVEMETIFEDVAMALGWVHDNIAQYGGDPQQIVVMGHSAGAQLAALLCVDHRYIESAGVPVAALKACVPVDGDTYDLPAIIQTAELRQALHRLPQPTKGHRVKFGNDPKKHVDFSVVTHVVRDKRIPPFLILHVAGHPDVTAQAQRLGAVLAVAEVTVKVVAVKDTDHRRLNANLGEPGDAATAELFDFLEPLVSAKR